MAKNPQCLGDLPDGWWRDKKTFEHEIAVHESNREVARAHGCVDYTIRKWRREHGLPASTERGQAVRGPEKQPRTKERPGLEIKGDVATLVTEPTPYKLGDMDALLRDRGLDPDEWDVERVLVNEWDAYAGRDEPYGDPRVVKLRQLKAWLKRRVPLSWVFPAVEVAARPKPKAGTASDGAKVVVVCGDQQAEYHDRHLHDVFLRWLADVKPDEGVLTGDLIDLPTISRHRDNPHWSAPVQACLDAGYAILSDYRDAQPDTRWRKLRGNHDYRLESELLTRAERMFGIKPADVPGEPEQANALSLRRLLHLDTLGVELVGREGDDWKFGEVRVADGLTVRHQPPSKAKLTRLTRSVIAGDTHRQSIEHVTEYADDGSPRVLAVVQTGCMADVKGGLGYAPDADWQQGFATAAIHDDGSMSFDLATYRGGVLTWRGERWS